MLLGALYVLCLFALAAAILRAGEWVRYRFRGEMRNPSRFSLIGVSNVPALRDSDIETRKRVLNESKASPIVDGVLSILLYNKNSRTMGPPPYADAIDLKEAFPETSEADLESAKERAAELLRSAYDAGDKHIEGRFKNFASVMQDLRAKHPGFLESTYEKVLSYGCYLAK